MTDFLVTVRVSAIDAVEAASEVRADLWQGSCTSATVVAVEED